MEATGIVRRIDDLARMVILEEIHRSIRIREGDPLPIPSSPWLKMCLALMEIDQRTAIGTVHIEHLPSLPAVAA